MHVVGEMIRTFWFVRVKGKPIHIKGQNGLYMVERSSTAIPKVHFVSITRRGSTRGCKRVLVRTLLFGWRKPYHMRLGLAVVYISLRQSMSHTKQ